MMVQESVQAASSPVQTSFLFPTAPTAQEASIAPPLSQSIPVPAESKPVSSGLSTQLIVAVVTGAITLVGGLAVWGVKYHYEQKAIEVKARQALRHDLLTETSDIVLTLRAARKAVVSSETGMLGPTRSRYDSKVAAWYKARPDLLDRAQTLLGPEFALLVDAPSGMNIITDRCGVVVTRDAYDRGKDCAARLAREVKVLTARQDAINSQKPAAPVGSDALIPGDYTTSLRIAHTLLDRVTSCKRLHPGSVAPAKAQALKRCPNLDNLQNALNLRVNLLGMRQIGIKNALPTA